MDTKLSTSFPKWERGWMLISLLFLTIFIASCGSDNTSSTTTSYNTPNVAATTCDPNKSICTINESVFTPSPEVITPTPVMNTPTPQISQASIVGVWTDSCQLSNELSFNTLQFSADGTLIVNNYVARYSITGNQVEFIANGGGYAYTYSISPSGNVLNLSDSQGDYCQLVRENSTGSQELESTVIGTLWTGNCYLENNDYKRVELQNGGVDMVDVIDVGGQEYNGTYNYSFPDASHVSFGDPATNSALSFEYLVSPDGKTLTLTNLDNASCTLTRS